MGQNDFWAFSNARLAVLAEHPKIRAHFLHDLPDARNRLTFAISTSVRGLPNLFPRLRARSRPALTLSLSRILSCLAIVARIEITASLKIPQESKYGSVKLR